MRDAAGAKQEELQAQAQQGDDYLSSSVFYVDSIPFDRDRSSGVERAVCKACTLFVFARLRLASFGYHAHGVSSLSWNLEPQ